MYPISAEEVGWLMSQGFKGIVRIDATEHLTKGFGADRYCDHFVALRGSQPVSFSVSTVYPTKGPMRRAISDEKPTSRVKYDRVVTARSVLDGRADPVG
jgi:hypothetical protein